jgi:hypothetical protein
MSVATKPNLGGRPPKFREPRRPITVTLPDRTLRRLEEIDTDRARAIVRAADTFTGEPSRPAPPVEIVKVGRDVAILVVAPSRCLAKIPWLRLVEIAPGRSLLTIPTGTPVDSLELAVLDLFEDPLARQPAERAVLEGLKKALARVRRLDSVSKAELLFVAPESARAAPGRRRPRPRS